MDDLINEKRSFREFIIDIQAVAYGHFNTLLPICAAGTTVHTPEPLQPVLGDPNTISALILVFLITTSFCGLNSVFWYCV